MALLNFDKFVVLSEEEYVNEADKQDNTIYMTPDADDPSIKITKNEIGNAKEVLFEDGKSFQGKLDDGTLRGADGAKGDAGAQGIQGVPGVKGDKGDNGADGLTTKITVNNSTYTQQAGTITLPNYPDPTTAINAHNDALNAHSAILWSGTQAQYDALPQATKNSLIIAAVTA